MPFWKLLKTDFLEGLWLAIFLWLGFIIMALDVLRTVFLLFLIIVEVLL